MCMFVYVWHEWKSECVHMYDMCKHVHKNVNTCMFARLSGIVTKSLCVYVDTSIHAYILTRTCNPTQAWTAHNELMSLCMYPRLWMASQPFATSLASLHAVLNSNDLPACVHIKVCMYVCMYVYGCILCIHT